MGGTRIVGQGQGGTCEKCGAQLEADALFCIVCGSPVTQGGGSPAADVAVARSCPQCGASVDSDALFCVVCGARVGNGANDQRAQVTRSCPNCGWSLEPDAMYCISCGALVHPGASSGGSNGSGPEPYDFPAMPEAQIGGFGDVGGRRGYEPVAPMTYAPVAPSAGGSTGAPITMVPAPPRADNDDDETVRPRLLLLTREEARTGCCKTIQVERGESIEVNVPAGVDVNTKMDVPGYGRFDEMTGQRGPLRVSFYID